MKKILVLIVLISSLTANAQKKSKLAEHFEAYYKQMQVQGDISGMISGLTHLNVISPSQARKDTLAYIYMSERKDLQALNTLGIEPNEKDSNIAVEVKAVCLKNLNQPDKAYPHYVELYKRNAKNSILAYELTELSIQLKKYDEAKKYLAEGIENIKEGMQKPFYESQEPYQVPLKSAFNYLKALLTYNQNPKNIDAPISILDETLKEAPGFKLATLIKNELLRQKQAQQSTTEKK